jgi:hypothetical protein
LLHEKRLQPHIGGFTQDSGTGYASADYHHIPMRGDVVYIYF